jgi:2-oxo-3-hexenedioate decarboxylase
MDVVDLLLQAEREGYAIQPISATRSLSLDEAYRIQQFVINRKLALDSHDCWIGLKAGLTSRAKQKMVNIDEPILGQLLSSNVVHGRMLHLDKMNQPRVEPEVAFCFGKEVTGHEENEEEVLTAVDYAFPALEILDSRFEKYKFQIQDVVADNASTARVVLGESRFPLDKEKLGSMKVSLLINGELCERGTADAVLGHPLTSALWVARKWASLGRTIPAGSILLTGGITTAIPISKGDTVVGQFEDLGELQFECG